MNEILFFGQNHLSTLLKNEPKIIFKPIHINFVDKDGNEIERKIKKISTGYFSTIFLFEDGEVIEERRSTETSRIEFSNIKDVEIGYRNQAILTYEGNVFAKGKDINPENPNEFINISSLIEDPNGRIIQDIVCSSQSIYLLNSKGNAYGIGDNLYGQLGFDSFKKAQKNQF
ncbi:protein rcc2 [Anaeramoeba ignava]|uniref:Protein rcc2 n=1 Tax=Anaeramoeba ignava TaxID=1746090 RepID=A0A9Q0RGA0_ANAIG|nr:protein rcc2 [Anaeramoeba ignava]